MDILSEAKQILEMERDAIDNISKKINASFAKAIDLIYSCKGRVIVIGIGKSGLIGKKMAATFASTGTPALFMHPSEGLHGDLGFIMRDDIALLISYSGEAEEILKIIPALKVMGIPLIALTGKKQSSLSKCADISIDIGVKKEACPHNLTPTTSTTTTLAIGDALAIVLLKKRGFRKEDFALFHPGGNLGKKLLLKIDDLMASGANNPVISEDKTMKEVILEISSKGMGATSIINKKGILVGIITDGDLRRDLQKYDNILNLSIREVMTNNPVVIESGKLAAEAIPIMEDRQSQIMVLPVVNTQKKPIGMVRIHDLVKAGLT